MLYIGFIKFNRRHTNMKDKTITGIIQQALQVLETEVGLARSSLEVVASRSFKPVSDFFSYRNEAYYCEALLNELDESYLKRLNDGAISRNVYNLRTRGIRILREIHETGSFLWKGPAPKAISVLPESFERVIASFTDPTLSDGKNREAISVARRFFQALADQNLCSIAQIKAEHMQAFLSDIAKSRPKSMDFVVSALRKLDRHLIASGTAGLPYAGLLMAPRARDRKIYPCMPQDDLSLIMRFVDRSTAIGKRDYAILMLAVSSGMRAGDIASIRLSDVDWRKNELRIVQGKTQKPISLPLQKGVGAALADYILNGRPVSKSPQIFLRKLAPYQRFKDGASVASVLRRRMKSVGIKHEIGDGKTMHGIRRMLGTHMTMEGVPVATIAQVLGHQNADSTRQYISLDIEGLRECALGFDSLGEGSK
jgi:integrase